MQPRIKPEELKTESGEELKQQPTTTLYLQKALQHKQQGNLDACYRAQNEAVLLELTERQQKLARVQQLLAQADNYKKDKETYSAYVKQLVEFKKDIQKKPKQKDESERLEFFGQYKWQAQELHEEAKLKYEEKLIDEAAFYAYLGNKNQVKNPIKAIRYFSLAIKLNSVDCFSIYRRGLSHLNLKNYDECEADFSSALQLLEDDPSVLFARGRLYITLEKFSAARADYIKAMCQTSPRSLTVADRFHILQFLNTNEVTQSSEDYLQNHLSANHDDTHRKMVADFITQANKAFSHQKYNEAFDLLKQASLISCFDHHIYTTRARFYRELNQAFQAYEECTIAFWILEFVRECKIQLPRNKFLALQEELFNILLKRVELAVELGFITAPAQDLIKLAELNHEKIGDIQKTFSHLLLKKGIEEKENDLDCASDYFAHALLCDSGNVLALIERAITSRLLNDPYSARKDLNEALKLKPNNLRAQRQLKITERFLERMQGVAKPSEVNSEKDKVKKKKKSKKKALTTPQKKSKPKNNAVRDVLAAEAKKAEEEKQASALKAAATNRKAAERRKLKMADLKLSNWDKALPEPLDEKIEFSENELMIANMLSERGINVYFVGGVIRRALGQVSKKKKQDLDFVTKGNAQQTLQQLEDYDPVDNTKKISGLISFYYSNATVFDMAVDIRHSPYLTITEDAKRRDFTFRALYADLNGNVYDITGLGLADYKNKLIRTCTPAMDSFADDPIRILNAIETLTNWDGSKLHEDIPPAIEARASLLLTKTSREELFAKLRNIFKSGNAEQHFIMFLKTGLWNILFPNLVPALIADEEWLLAEFKKINEMHTPSLDKIFINFIVSWLFSLQDVHYSQYEKLVDKVIDETLLFKDYFKNKIRPNWKIIKSLLDAKIDAKYDAAQAASQRAADEYKEVRRPERRYFLPQEQFPTAAQQVPCHYLGTVWDNPALLYQPAAAAAAPVAAHPVLPAKAPQSDNH